MAITILGRVQGGSIFYSTTDSSTSINKNTLQPANLTPLVGDNVLFSNGDLRTIISIVEDTVTCGDVVTNLLGPKNTLVIGTVSAGEEASATLTGESPNQVLNLVLPRGEQGIQGEIGEPGPATTLTIGTVTQGTTANATLTGESPNQVLNLTLPLPTDYTKVGVYTTPEAALQASQSDSKKICLY